MVKDEEIGQIVDNKTVDGARCTDVDDHGRELLIGDIYTKGAARFIGLSAATRHPRSFSQAR